jgi:hypothetical protein
MSTAVDIYTALPYMQSCTPSSKPRITSKTQKTRAYPETRWRPSFRSSRQTPKAGDVLVGTGGARKLRFAASGTGKRGGVRTVHYFGGDDVPVFMLAVIKKVIATIYRRRSATH